MVPIPPPRLEAVNPNVAQFWPPATSFHHQGRKSCAGAQFGVHLTTASSWVSAVPLGLRRPASTSPKCGKWTLASIGASRMVEAWATLAYVGCWQALPLRWKGTGRWPVPPEWHRVGLRQSLVSGTNRHAALPVNGVLNDAYVGLEGQVRTATDVPKSVAIPDLTLSPTSSHTLSPSRVVG